MKGRTLILSLVLLLELVLASQRVCKTQVLRSFGLHSRVTARQGNSLCPKISYNCCTRHDQMKIHKNWNQHDKNYLFAAYESAHKGFMSLSTVLMNKGQYVMKEILAKFEKYAKPPEKFMTHLMNLTGEYDKRTPVQYNTMMKGLDKKLKAMFKEIQKYRQGFLCNLCNWRNHQFYNPQSMTVTYNQKFCLQLSIKYIDLLWEKYGEVFRFVNVMDEIMLMLSGERMIDPIDHAIFHRYTFIIDKCKKDTSKIENCADVCREFNLNKFSYMWDGEMAVIKKFMKNYEKKWKKLDDPDDMLALFKYRRDEWTQSKFKRFVDDQSVLSSKFLETTGMREPNKNSFDLDFKGNAVKNFVEHFHPTNSVQIETLDDELSAYALYRMVEPPVDISKFLIVFDPNTGIDLKKDSAEMNFDASVDQILALLNTSGGDVKSLNEIIDNPVKLLMKDVQIIDIADFINDPYIEFAKVVKPPPKKKQNERGLSSAGRFLASIFTSLLALIVLS